MSVNKKKVLEHIAIAKFRSAHRQIAEQLRHEIASGGLQLGAKLPPATQLATAWNVSTFTIHKALTILVESGLLVRQRKKGTFVAARSAKLKTVALYYGRNFLADGAATEFYRRLNQWLIRKLAERGIENQLFIDSRAEADHTALPESLKQAVEHRDVQAIIAPLITDEDFLLVQKLPLPCAFFTNWKASDKVEQNFRQFFEVGLDQLVGQGCHDIALITASITNHEDARHDLFVKPFLELAAERRLTVRNEWVRAPREFLGHEHMENFGRVEFERLWALEKRPQAVIVHPDVLVRGVISALTENNVSVPDELRLVFHRNEGVRLRCPFPATWMTMSTEAIAKALIDLIERQMDGEAVKPVYLPFQVTNESGH